MIYGSDVFIYPNLTNKQIKKHSKSLSRLIIKTKLLKVHDWGSLPRRLAVYH